MSKKSSVGKRLFLILRIAVAVGLITWVFMKFVDVRQFADLARRTDRKLLILGLCTELLPIGFTTLRWHLLLRPVGLRQSFFRTLHFTYLGLFFNNFLVGLTGGDLVKAFLIARGSDRKAGAVLTVFVDRLIGLVTLAGIAAAACATRFSSEEFRVAAAITWGFLGAFTLFCLVYFNRRLRTLQFVRRLRRVLPGRRILVELDAAGRAYRGKWALLAAAAALSIASHASSLIGAWAFSHALGFPIPLVDILVYVPVIMMIVSIPVSVGTWGVGEAAFIGFFRKVGMPEATAVALSLLVRLGQAFWTLPGALFLVLDAGERKAVQEAEKEAEAEEEKDVDDGDPTSGPPAGHP